jgi:hypothetical protein
VLGINIALPAAKKKILRWRPMIAKSTRML